MVVEDIKSAQVTIVLASNDAVQIDRLRRDLNASEIRYFLAILSDRAILVNAAAAQISAIGGATPIVFVIDYKFAVTDCEVLSQASTATHAAAPIACIVINPPLQYALRQRLKALGVRLFDGDSARIWEHLTPQ